MSEMSQEYDGQAWMWDRDGAYWYSKDGDELTPWDVFATMCANDAHIDQLEAERDECNNRYHMAEAKVLSRDALLKQLSETQLAQDVTKAEAENAALKRLLTSMTCGECDETMLDCTCPDTKSLLTAEESE